MMRMIVYCPSSTESISEFLAQYISLAGHGHVSEHEASQGMVEKTRERSVEYDDHGGELLVDRDH